MHGTFDAAAPSARSPRRPGGTARALPLALRIALRDLRAGLRGFVVFIACIALGVGAIVGVASIARSLVDGVARESGTILGADAAFALIGREANPAERDALLARGALSSVASLRAMSVAPDGAALVEVKAVDGSYPQRGQVETEPARPFPDLLAGRDGVYGAVADPALFDRLDLKPGARLTIGSATFELRARLLSEPDKIANGIGFGPRLLMSQDALRATGLLQPGSLMRWTYRLILPAGRDSDADLQRTVAEIGRAAPEAGWDVRTRANADPRFTANILRFSQFLTIIGLTALLVGGVGVTNAVAAFVDRKRASIAILKSIGATSRTVMAIFVAEVVAVALIGIAGGLLLGALMLVGATYGAGSLLPIPISPRLAGTDVLLAMLYGLLTALAFSLPALGRAQDIPVSGLFRDRVTPDPRWPRPAYLIAAALAGLGLVAVAVAAAQDRRVALIFVAAAAAAFILLRLVALGLMAAVKRLPPVRRPVLRLALANLHRPGTLMPSMVLSLGLGITLLVAVAAIDRNLSRAISQTLPERAPNFFFIDVPGRDAEAFGRFLSEKAPGSALEAVPMMRGRITGLKDRPVAEAKASQEAAWVLEGDRGITYAAAPPEGSSVTDGSWWPADYRGSPLVSFDEEIAHGLGLAIGDSVTVNVLGRNLTARIANLRKVDWRRLGINFVMVFSPNTFAGAPHTELMTITLAPGSAPGVEPRLLREVATAFPAVTSVRVKDALEAFSTIVAQLVLAVRVASSVALLASALVLAGALAAGHRARLYDAVVLKTLGATRPKLLLAYTIEYGALGLATGLFGLAAGTGAAWYVVTRVMKLTFGPELLAGGSWALLAIATAVLLALAGTWRILGQKPARHLRSL